MLPDIFIERLAVRCDGIRQEYLRGRNHLRFDDRQLCFYPVLRDTPRHAQRMFLCAVARLNALCLESAMHRTPVSWQAETNVVYLTASIGAWHFNAKAQRNDIA